MGWWRCQDDIHNNKKLSPLSQGCLGLYVTAISICNADRTDGVLTGGSLVTFKRRFGWNKTVKGQLSDLLDAGAMQVVDGGYTVINFLKHNRSKAERDEISEKRAKAGRKGGKQVASTTTVLEEEVEIEEEVESEVPPLSPASQLTLSSEDPNAKPQGFAESVSLVWGHYCARLSAHRNKKTTSKLTRKGKRYKSIKMALLEHSVGDLCSAIDGMFITPHNLGQNDRGSEFLDVTIAMRETNIVRFIGNAANPVPAGLTDYDRKCKQWLEDAHKRDQTGGGLYDGDGSTSEGNGNAASSPLLAAHERGGDGRVVEAAGPLLEPGPDSDNPSSV